MCNECLQGTRNKLNEGRMRDIVTNVSPQVALGFNRGYWMLTEKFVRSLSRKFDDVYVITGPLFLPRLDVETGHYYVKYRVLGDPPNTAVPTHFFKVILAVKGKDYSIGSFVLPNAPIEHETPLDTFDVPISGMSSPSIYFDIIKT